MKRPPIAPCDFCGLKGARHRKGCRRMTTDATTSRWRYLTYEQRLDVFVLLSREQVRLMRLAARARQKSESMPQPFRGVNANRAMGHASKAGALRILAELLEAIGGHP